LEVVPARPSDIAPVAPPEEVEANRIKFAQGEKLLKSPHHDSQYPEPSEYGDVSLLKLNPALVKAAPPPNLPAVYDGVPSSVTDRLPVESVASLSVRNTKA
jgi:hypothetical protein